MKPGARVVSRWIVGGESSIIAWVSACGRFITLEGEPDGTFNARDFKLED